MKKRRLTFTKEANPDNKRWYYIIDDTFPTDMKVVDKLFYSSTNNDRNALRCAIRRYRVKFRNRSFILVREVAG